MTKPAQKKHAARAKRSTEGKLKQGPPSPIAPMPSRRFAPGCQAILNSYRRACENVHWNEAGNRCEAAAEGNGFVGYRPLDNYVSEMESCADGRELYHALRCSWPEDEGHRHARQEATQNKLRCLDALRRFKAAKTKRLASSSRPPARPKMQAKRTPPRSVPASGRFAALARMTPSTGGTADRLGSATGSPVVDLLTGSMQGSPLLAAASPQSPEQLGSIVDALAHPAQRLPGRLLGGDRAVISPSSAKRALSKKVRKPEPKEEEVLPSPRKMLDFS